MYGFVSPIKTWTISCVAMHVLPYLIYNATAIKKRSFNHENLVLDPIKLRRQNSRYIKCKKDPVSV